MAKRNWYRLDNSAKIMPCTTTNLNTNVFRLTCTLFEDIDSKALQEALDKTLIEFPMYLCTMKDGLFWHYLEKVDYKPLENDNNYFRIVLAHEPDEYKKIKELITVSMVEEDTTLANQDC